MASGVSSSSSQRRRYPVISFLLGSTGTIITRPGRRLSISGRTWGLAMMNIPVCGDDSRICWSELRSLIRFATAHLSEASMHINVRSEDVIVCSIFTISGSCGPRLVLANFFALLKPVLFPPEPFPFRRRPVSARSPEYWPQTAPFSLQSLGRSMYPLYFALWTDRTTYPLPVNWHGSLLALNHFLFSSEDNFRYLINVFPTSGLYCCWWPYTCIGGVSIYLVINKLDTPDPRTPIAKQYCLITFTFPTSVMPASEFLSLQQPFSYIVDVALLDIPMA